MTLLSVALLLLAQADPTAPRLPWGGTDFIQYYVAWEFIHAGKNPYDARAGAARQMAYGRDKSIEILAPPWGLLPAWAVAGLPLPEATFRYVLMNVGLLVIAGLCWQSLLFSGNWLALPFLFLGIFLWLGSLTLLGFGQNSGWVLAGISGWLVCTKRRWHALAGLCMVLTAVKPHLALMPGLVIAAHTLQRRHWATIVAFLLGLAAATTATFWIRPEIWSEYVTSIRTGLPVTAYHGASLDGWMRLHVVSWFHYLAWPLWVVGLLVIVIGSWRAFAPGRLEENASRADEDPLVRWLVMACVGSVALLPYVLDYDYILMLPGYFFALCLWLGNRPRAKAGMLVWFCLHTAFLYMYFNGFTYDNFWVIGWGGFLVTGWNLRISGANSAGHSTVHETHSTAFMQ